MFPSSRKLPCSLVSCGLIILFVNPAKAIEFTGTLGEFAAYLRFSEGLNIALDPLYAQGDEATQQHRFRQREGEDDMTFVKRCAQSSDLIVEPLEGRFHWITSGAQKDDEATFKLFARRKYREVAAARKKGNSVQLALVSKLILDAYRDKPIRIKAIQKHHKKLAFLKREIEHEQRASRNLRSVELARLGRELETVADEYGETMRQEWEPVEKLLENKPAEFQKLLDLYQNANVVVMAWLEYQIALVDPFVKAWEQDPFAKKGTIEITPTDIMKSLRARGRAIKADSKKAQQIMAEATALMEDGDSEAALKKTKEVIALGEFSRDVRAQLATLHSDVVTAQILAQKKAWQDPEKKLYHLAGLDADSLALLNEELGTTFALRKQAPKNPGRTGAIYGLTVTSDTLNGHVSTFAVQFQDRLPPDRARNNPKILPSDGSDQIEINSHKRQVLDSAMVASIKDAMHYVDSEHTPNMLARRIVISFDQSVDVLYGGDSAGVALAIAAISQEDSLVPRDDLCMTGSIRSFGDVREVGGIAAKVQAAADKGFQMILLPEANLSDLAYLSLTTLDQLEIVTGKVMTDYLRFALPSYEATKDPQAMLALRRYALAVNLVRNGLPGKGRFVLQALLEDFPQHYSARNLDGRLAIMGIAPVAVPETLLLKEL